MGATTNVSIPIGKKNEILPKNDWIREEKIGQGAYGAVFRGINRRTNQKHSST